MAEAANVFIEALDEDQRARMVWPLGGDEQTTWFYTPTDHGGLSLAEMTGAQHHLLYKLLSTGVSRAGYVTASAIIGLENVLDMTEGWAGSFRGRERARDPLLYLSLIHI